MTQETNAIEELRKALVQYFDTDLKAKMFGAKQAVELKKIDLDGVTFSLLTIEYENTRDFPINPDVLFEKEIENPTDATIHSRFEKTSQSTDTFKWSVTEGLKLGASATFKASVPLIGQAKATVSAELSLGAGQETTATKTESWSVSDVIDIPPQHAIKVEFILNQARPDTPFRAVVEAHGGFKYFTDPAPFGGVDGFWADLDGGVQWLTRPDWQGQPVLPGAALRRFEARGNFSGALGLRARLQTSDIRSLV